ncbi:MAG: alpha/beta hydrolase [Cyanobacteria bacterium P01_D01_bin.128]
MKILPFIVQKFVFRDQPGVEPQHCKDKNLVQLVDIAACPDTQANIPGYFVMSSAPPNIEDPQTEEEIEGARQAVQGIQEIAQHLYRIHQSGGPAPELVITVHGYNTSRSSVTEWYKDIFRYINRYDPAIAQTHHQVFIGYRWPSENIKLARLWESLAALPPLPRDILILGGIGALVTGILEIFALRYTPVGLMVGSVFTLAVLLATMMATLVILRLIVYFRDRYRASNFGVLDLVELLRQIDQALVNLKTLEFQGEGAGRAAALEQSRQFWCRPETPRIKLTLIGHSMGGFVCTHLVRILSDVFDNRSIDKQPPSDLGTVFRLERLLLASPDIPVMAIISRRANFLASSLRRFAESYLFSSEGDIALRTASTAVNYISFPSRTEPQGYRLGNVSLKHKYSDRQAATDDKNYGIVNLGDLDQNFIPGMSLQEMILNSKDRVLENLFLTCQRFGGEGRYQTLDQLFTDSAQVKLAGENPDLPKGDRATVADFFTFFDCTDYKDVAFNVRELDHPPSIAQPKSPKGILTSATRKRALNTLDYIRLTLDYAFGKRDVHGGYFQGEFSQQLIYRIAFLGFTGYLKSLHDQPDTAYDSHVSLSKLHMSCRDLGIQSFLSPVRYRVDIQGKSVTDTKDEMLKAIAVSHKQ